MLCYLWKQLGCFYLPQFNATALQTPENRKHRRIQWFGAWTLEMAKWRSPSSQLSCLLCQRMEAPGRSTHPHTVGGSWLLAVRAFTALCQGPVLPARRSLLSSLHSTVTRCLRGQHQLVQVGLGVGGRQAADLGRGWAAGDGDTLREFNPWHLFGSQAEALQPRQI